MMKALKLTQALLLLTGFFGPCFSFSFSFSFSFTIQRKPCKACKPLFSAMEQSSSSVSSASSVPAYLIVEAQITDMEQFADYATIVPSIVKQYGGEYIVLRGKHTPLEGDWGYDLDCNTEESPMMRRGNAEEGDEEIIKKFLGINDNDTDSENDVVETKIVIQKWPSVDMAKKFWDSPEYAQVKKLREGTGTFRIMLVEGLSNVSEQI